MAAVTKAIPTLRPIRWALILLVLLVPLAPPLYAQEKKGADYDPSSLKGPLNITADRIRQNRREDTAEAKGNVIVEYEDALLLGESAYLNNAEGYGIMEGDVRLLMENMRMEGSKARFDLNTDLGWVDNGHGYSRGGYVFGSTRATRLEQEKWHFQDGTLTTCDPSDPDWIFTSSETTLWQENLVVLQNTWVHFKGVPIFYAPVWAAPAATKRKSGFLQPGFGYRNRDGTYVNTSYYWVTSPHDDVTFFLDWLDYRGTREGLEYRYAFAEETRGILTLDFIADQDTRENLWRVEADHRHRFDNGIYNKAKIEAESPTSYSQEFTRDVSLQSKRYTDSFIDFSYTRGNRNLSLLTRSYRDLSIYNNSDEQHFEKLPEVAASFAPREIFGTPLIGGVEASATSFHWYQRANDVVRFDETINRTALRPYAALPLTPARWMNLRPWMEGRAAWYSLDKQKEGAVSTMFYQAGLDMEGPRINRVFSGENLALKHTVTPVLEYKYIPGYDTDGESRRNVISLDNTDALGPTNSLTLKLINRLFTKTLKNNAIKQIATLNINQGYDIRKADNPDPDGKRRPLSNLLIDLDSKPLSWLVFNYTMSYNHYVSDTESSLTELGVKSDSGWFFSAAHNYRRDPRSMFLSAIIGYETGMGISVEAAGIYDQSEEKYLSDQIKIEYSSCCYSASLTATGLRKNRTVDGELSSYWDVNYMFLFEFKGLGETSKPKERIFAPKI